MITKWAVNNFKSIREDTELNMAQLTIFAGANSSGKSTLIQSILLIAQTLSNKVSSRSVVLNGALTALGQFDDLKSSDSETNEISIKWSCSPIERMSRRASVRYSRAPQIYRRLSSLPQEISNKISFDSGEPVKNGKHTTEQPKNLYQIHPRLCYSHIECKFENNEEEEQTNKKFWIEASIKNDIIRPTNNLAENIHERFLYNLKFDKSFEAETKEQYKSAVSFNCKFHHFLPSRVFFKIEYAEAMAEKIIKEFHHISYSLRRHRSPIDRKKELNDKSPEELKELGDKSPEELFSMNGELDIDDNLPNEIWNYLKNSLGIFDEDLFNEKSNITYRAFFKTIEDYLQGILKYSIITSKQHILGRYFEQKQVFYQKVYSLLEENLKEGDDRESFVNFALSDEIEESYNYLNNFFTNSFRYLGPLRDSPRAVYPLVPSMEPDDIGLKGERTASILELHKNEEIRYIKPESFKNFEVNKKPIRASLENAVIDWLKYLGIASSVESEDKGKSGHELQVSPTQTKSNKNNYDLTHVGVGVSQVLPILVMGLLAGEDSTLVFEQPELHLHPSVQSLLGDFFLSMAMCSKQCIVETHSEHLINRLRMNVAHAGKQEEEKEILDLTKIYFVENFSGTSKFREVKINEYGNIIDWPEGFFDESVRQSEKILKASLEKRKART